MQENHRWKPVRGSQLPYWTKNDIQKANIAKKKEDIEKRTNKTNDNIKAIIDVTAVRALNLDPKKTTNKQLATLLKPLKIKEDTVMPTKKNAFLSRYNEWMSRPLHPMPATTPVVDPDIKEIVLSDEEDNGLEEDTIDAMMSLHWTANV